MGKSSISPTLLFMKFFVLCIFYLVFCFRLLAQPEPHEFDSVWVKHGVRKVVITKSSFNAGKPSRLDNYRTTKEWDSTGRVTREMLEERKENGEWEVIHRDSIQYRSLPNESFRILYAGYTPRGMYTEYKSEFIQDSSGKYISGYTHGWRNKDLFLTEYRFQYDSLGRLYRKIGSKNFGSSNVELYTYDSASRLLSALDSSYDTLFKFTHYYGNRYSYTKEGKVHSKMYSWCNSDCDHLTATYYANREDEILSAELRMSVWSDVPYSVKHSILKLHNELPAVEKTFKYDTSGLLLSRHYTFTTIRLFKLPYNCPVKFPKKGRLRRLEAITKYEYEFW